MIPKPLQKKLFSCCLSVIRNEIKLREQLSSNGNVKSGTFIRQGLSLPQIAKEFSPARKHLIRTQLKMPEIWWKKLASSSHVHLPSRRKENHKMPGSGGCYMKRVSRRHISALQADMLNMLNMRGLTLKMLKARGH